jgi:protein TonB
MPLLHLIDRPDDGEYGFERRGQGIGAFASAASHGAAALLLLIGVQVARQAPPPAAISTFNPQRLVWLPNADAGGGKPAGGNQSKDPAQSLSLPGRNEMSIAATPTRSTDSTVEPPLEPLPISAQPAGHAVSFLPGPVSSDSTVGSLGPNTGPGGNGDGPTPGDGTKPGRGFGEGFGPRGPGVTTPSVITQVKPQYTAEAMRAKVQGLVMVECVVLPDGTVGDARILRSLDPIFGLDQEAIAAAKKWRFKPGMMNGKPVPVIVTIELSFTLR